MSALATKHQPLYLTATLRVALFGAEVSDDPPAKLVVIPWGRSEADDGPVIVNEVTVQSMAALNVHPWDSGPLDFEHSTERKDIPHPKPVAAHGKWGIAPGEGVSMNGLRWTPAGDRAWRDRSYPDLSPTIAMNANREVVFVKSAGLCMNGRIKGLHSFGAFSLNQTIDSVMNEREILVSLLKQMGIDVPPDATAEQIAALAAKATEKPAAMGAGADDIRKAVEDAIKPFGARIEELATKLKKSEADAEALEKDRLLKEAAGQGKDTSLFSADALKLLTPAALKSMLDAVKPGTVPTEPKTAGAKEGDGTKTFSAEDIRTAKELGLTEEDLKKFA